MNSNWKTFTTNHSLFTISLILFFTTKKFTEETLFFLFHGVGLHFIFFLVRVLGLFQYFLFFVVQLRFCGNSFSAIANRHINLLVGIARLVFAF